MRSLACDSRARLLSGDGTNNRYSKYIAIQSPVIPRAELLRLRFTPLNMVELFLVGASSPLFPDSDQLFVVRVSYHRRLFCSISRITSAVIPQRHVSLLPWPPQPRAADVFKTKSTKTTQVNSDWISECVKALETNPNTFILLRYSFSWHSLSADACRSGISQSAANVAMIFLFLDDQILFFHHPISWNLAQFPVAMTASLLPPPWLHSPRVAAICTSITLLLNNNKRPKYNSHPKTSSNTFN